MAPSAAVAGQVARPVKPLAGRAGNRIGDEFLGRQLGPAMIAAGQTDAADVQLARNSHRHGVLIAIEQMNANVGDRPADRHGVPPILVPAMPRRDVDGGLRWAVEVMQFGRRAGRREPPEVCRRRHPPGAHAARLAAQVGRRRIPGGSRRPARAPSLVARRHPPGAHAARLAENGEESLLQFVGQRLAAADHAPSATYTAPHLRSCRNTSSIDGTKCSVVMPSSAIVCTR